METRCDISGLYLKMYIPMVIANAMHTINPIIIMIFGKLS